MRNSKSISILLAIFISLLFTQCMKTDKEKIEDAVRSLNKMCPFTPEPTMRVDGAEYVPEKAIRLKFTLLQDVEDDEKEFYANLMQDALKVAYLELIRNNKDLKPLKDINTIFMFQLTSQNNVRLADVEITPEEYNKPSEEGSPKLTGSYDDDLEPMLQVVAASIKKQLPMSFGGVDDVLFTDCDAEGKNLTYTFLLKDNFLKDLKTEEDKEYFTLSMVMSMEEMINADYSMKKLIDSGVIAKFVFEKEDGNIYTNFDITKEDLK